MNMRRRTDVEPILFRERLREISTEKPVYTSMYGEAKAMEETRKHARMFYLQLVNIFFIVSDFIFSTILYSAVESRVTFYSLLESNGIWFYAEIISAALWVLTIIYGFTVGILGMVFTGSKRSKKVKFPVATRGLSIINIIIGSLHVIILLASFAFIL